LKKNTCFFNTIVFWGGGEKLHFETALEFEKLGHDIVVCSNLNAPLYKKSILHGFDVFSLSVRNLSFLNPFKIYKCIRFFKKNNIDTVIFSASQDFKMAGISAKFARVKNIVYLRGLAVSIKSNIVNRYLFKSCLTHIIANSEETRRMILKNLSHVISKNKLHTIYHGIDISQITSSNNEKLKEIKNKTNGIILGNAGRLTDQKGQHYLIDIAKKLKLMNLEFTLFIAGTGSLESEIKQRIIKNQLQKEVVMLGFVEDMNLFMNSLDIFLLTSKWEGFGFVLVEAMAKKVPVVCFDITSNPEIIEDKKTGFLTPFCDLNKFAEHVYSLATNRKLLEEMGSAGQRRVTNKFLLSDRILELDQVLN
jgi:glycosyltransferase involved in cell wall biosynthesis